MKKTTLGIVSLALVTVLWGCKSNNGSNDVSVPASDGSIEISASDITSNSGTSSKPSTSDSTNSQGSDLLEKGALTYSQVIDLLENTMANEALYVSNATIKNTDFSGAITYVSEENFEVFGNYSSFATGTVKRTNEKNEVLTDNYIRRLMAVNEKFEVEGKISNYTMFEKVIDYKDDVMSRQSYEDKAEKKFIIETQEEANNSGLSADSYILLGAYPVETSPQASYNTMTFVATIASNIYVSQLGKTKINYVKNGEGNYVFAFEASFSYSGDWGGDTIYEKLTLEFVLSADQSKLLSTKYLYTMDDVMDDEPDDHYITGYEWEASLVYNERRAVPNDIVDTREYFLETVEDVQIIARYNGDNKVDADAIPSTTSYIFGEAKTYTPSKALTLSLTNAGSSNPSVVEFTSDGYLKVVGEGTTILTFSYFKKGADDIFRYEEIEKEVTIVTPNPTSVGFSYNYEVEENTLMSGKTYEWKTYVLPSKASQEITAISDNEEVLSVTVDDDNNLVLVAHKEGIATITIASTVDPSITASKTFTVMNANLDFASIITTKTYEFTYVYPSTPQYTLTMTFDADGHGKIIQYVFSNGKSYEDTFDYVIKENNIVFSNWNRDAYKKYETGTIIDSGNKISCFEPTYYSTDIFEAK
ncbi:MAG: hypothetical protein J1F31_05140 [Erysipelotrichales bacterium]|nr:hypothetical protein [Erysipelotrichales bacterium]